MRQKIKLPKHIIPLPNPDKQDHEKWYDGRDLLDIPSPFCMLICGPKGSGKSTLIKNILCRATPLYDFGYLVHFDGESTNEYDDIDINILPEGQIPHNTEIEKDGKKIIIFEDLPYESLSKEDHINLTGLLKYSTTHKNLSIIFTTHDFTSIPAKIRRLFNVYIIYKMPDLNSLSVISSRVGMRNTDLQSIFQNCISTNHDFLMIDLTKNTPVPLRINGYKPIKIT
jgi:energy-coupling factor transporter ATP-binding protein EcfA2